MHAVCITISVIAIVIAITYMSKFQYERDVKIKEIELQILEKKLQMEPEV